MSSNGRIAASPLPMQHSDGAIFVGPTGALTEINISFFFAIFLGAEQHLIKEFLEAQLRGIMVRE